MDVQIKDAVALRRITPSLLSAYLTAQGWVRGESWRDRIVVWSRETEGAAADIMAPLREQSDAYAVRMSEAVAALAQLEERSQLDVYYDLLGAGADVIRLRPMLSSHARHDWSLSESVDLLGRMKDLLQTAARTAESPGRPVYSGRLSASVQDYVRDLRPLPGYEWGEELTIHSPVPVAYMAQYDMGDQVRQPPFPRRVTYALNQGLGEVAKTAEAVLGGEDIDSFDAVARYGVSANLCEAVAALARQGNGIELSVTWAPVRPSEESEGHFSFPQSAADLLGEGASLLRQKHPILDIVIEGEIIRLDRRSRQDFDGDATVLAEVDGKNVALDVRFDTADCDEVLRAFQHNLQIAVRGNIDRSGRRHHLQNPSNFVVVE